jgi:hypothetical protein
MHEESHHLAYVEGTSAVASGYLHSTGVEWYPSFSIMQSTGEFQSGILREGERYFVDIVAPLAVALASTFWLSNGGGDHQYGKA